MSRVYPLGGYIYIFGLNQFCGPYKIGTTTNLSNRLCQLKSRGERSNKTVKRLKLKINVKICTFLHIWVSPRMFCNGPLLGHERFLLDEYDKYRLTCRSTADGNVKLFKSEWVDLPLEKIIDGINKSEYSLNLIGVGFDDIKRRLDDDKRKV